MKIFALLSCLFALTAASYSPYSSAIGYGLGYGYGGYHGPQHLPVIGPHGVPLEPPANVAARAQHAAAVVEAKARNGDYSYGGYAGAYGYTPALAYGGYAHGGPVIGPAGVPLELPANVAARAQHAVAVAQTRARDAHYGYGGLYGGYAVSPAIGYGHGLYAAQHLPIIGPHGVPLEPPANVAARIQHAAAHAEANARSGHYGHLYGRKRRSIYGAGAYYAGAGYHGAQHIPVIGPLGVPLEPPANVAARAAHAAAHAAAGGHGGYLGPAAAYGGYGAYGYGVAPLAHNGVPHDTPEVAHAKAAHFAAVAEAKARNGVGYGSPYGYGAGAYGAGAYGAYGGGYAQLSHSGVPLDTPEVAHAKAAHLAAHAAAAHGGHY